MNVQSLNQIILVGTVHENPKISNAKTGTYACATLYLETTQKLTKANRGGSPRIRTEIHKCILYRNKASGICDLGDIVGKVVNVIGTMHYRKWTDENGINHTDPCINVLDYTMISDTDAAAYDGENEEDWE